MLKVKFKNFNFLSFHFRSISDFKNFRLTVKNQTVNEQWPSHCKNHAEFLKKLQKKLKMNIFQVVTTIEGKKY